MFDDFIDFIANGGAFVLIAVAFLIGLVLW